MATNEQWCITATGILGEATVYLGWQPDTWDDGYFWTDEATFTGIAQNSTPKHPFLFNSRQAAIRHLKTLNIPQRCHVVVWNGL